MASENVIQHIVGGALEQCVPCTEVAYDLVPVNDSDKSTVFAFITPDLNNHYFYKLENDTVYKNLGMTGLRIFPESHYSTISAPKEVLSSIKKDGPKMFSYGLSYTCYSALAPKSGVYLFSLGDVIAEDEEVPGYKKTLLQNIYPTTPYFYGNLMITDDYMIYGLNMQFYRLDHQLTSTNMLGTAYSYPDLPKSVDDENGYTTSGFKEGVTLFKSSTAKTNGFRSSNVDDNIPCIIYGKRVFLLDKYSTSLLTWNPEEQLTLVGNTLPQMTFFPIRHNGKPEDILSSLKMPSSYTGSQNKRDEWTQAVQNTTHEYFIRPYITSGVRCEAYDSGIGIGIGSGGGYIGATMLDMAFSLVSLGTSVTYNQNLKAEVKFLNWFSRINHPCMSCTIMASHSLAVTYLGNFIYPMTWVSSYSDRETVLLQIKWNNRYTITTGPNYGYVCSGIKEDEIERINQRNHRENLLIVDGLSYCKHHINYGIYSGDREMVANPIAEAMPIVCTSIGAEYKTDESLYTDMLDISIKGIFGTSTKDEVASFPVANLDKSMDLYKSNLKRESTCKADVTTVTGNASGLPGESVNPIIDISRSSNDGTSFNLMFHPGDFSDHLVLVSDYGNTEKGQITKTLTQDSGSILLSYSTDKNFYSKLFNLCRTKSLDNLKSNGCSESESTIEFEYTSYSLASYGSFLNPTVIERFHKNYFSKSYRNVVGRRIYENSSYNLHRLGLYENVSNQYCLQTTNIIKNTYTIKLKIKYINIYKTSDQDLNTISKNGSPSYIEPYFIGMSFPLSFYTSTLGIIKAGEKSDTGDIYGLFKVHVNSMSIIPKSVDVLASCSGVGTPYFTRMAMGGSSTDDSRDLNSIYFHTNDTIMVYNIITGKFKLYEFKFYKDLNLKHMHISNWDRTTASLFNVSSSAIGKTLILLGEM